MSSVVECLELQPAEISGLKAAGKIFSMYLQVAATVVKGDCNKLIDYLGYKEAVAKAPKVLQNFVPTKIFIDLLQISDETGSDGLVPVDSIINYIILRKRKMMNVISLHYYDSVGNGYLTGEENEETLEYYLHIATQKFIFLLDPMRQNKIRIIDIVASRLLEEMQALNEETANTTTDGGTAESEENEQETSKSGETFSKENCLRIKEMYFQLDSDFNGLLSLSEMTDFQKDPSALSYYFRIMDVDGDNLLTAPDISFFYREIAEMLEDNFPENSSQKAPSLEVIVSEVLDMCHPKNPHGITLKELISSGKGGTVVGMLTDLDAFFEYENREEHIFDE
ncbi:unnamed protein product [Gongylonema pulchrum]|uniref:EF-hand domain-containing protein n=1 Tax=Gongylonema pulchrum TaxID=637853 RepID=A0A183DNQ7_9BILA|nr:unnamed protein product [Gongylonema pulchrum]